MRRSNSSISGLNPCGEEWKNECSKYVSLALSLSLLFGGDLSSRVSPQWAAERELIGTCTAHWTESQWESERQNFERMQSFFLQSGWGYFQAISCGLGLGLILRL